MQTTIETLGKLERRLVMEVPHDQIEREVEDRLKQMARTVRLHGFRPGKVPMKIVTKQFGPQVRSEVIGAAVEKSFGDAVRDQNLRVAGYPRIEPKSDGDGKSLAFSATFEVYPEIAIGDLAVATVERPTIEVGAAEVDKTIEILRKQRATLVPVDRAAAKEDRVTIDFDGTRDGVPFEGGSAKGFSFVVGEGRMLADFDRNVEGMAPGSTKTFDVAFPADYGAKDIAGKVASFTVTLHGVEEPKLPALDAEFSRSLGVASGDLDEMRAQVKENLEREVKKRVQAKIKDQVMKALVESTPLDLPNALIDMEIQGLIEMAKRDLAARGVKAPEVPLPPDLFAEQAKRRVALGLIVSELVRVNALHAKPEQVRAVVDDLAQSYEDAGEVVSWYYSDPKRLQDVEANVLEDNVVNWVMARAKVVDTAVAFDDLMRNQR
jgi:trigger factor